ncbi:SDR family NAD(P)-dependent oxidoreductase [Entomobacter blattae]|uniref:3-oxoacyl-[acyl-carrier-protein] reductase FabG n=1 Tax=Entomobacter blattae TaxID=2762277 RepID=A0A7H1NUC8_9PROT|nr:SDR family oxidoreductase [Entomobacter blattae]QNT79388.1 3-oxoacyl-[acyl-carrier-protein] reductase FabG [Entomobacter blattae]
MKISNTGKLAIVSGSTLGIGFAIAQKLAETGAEVVVNGRTEAKTKEACSKLSTLVPHGQFLPVAGDLGSGAGVAEFVKKIPRADILVNNLGIFEEKNFEDVTDEDWQRFFEINVMSGVRLTRHYLPEMVKKRWGRVAFIASESALNIPPNMIHYGFTKTAQVAIARGLAESVAGSGVTVNSILPGPTRTEGVMEMFRAQAQKTGKSVEEVEKNFIPEHRSSSLIQRLIEPEEVGNMVAFVCSDLASATSGASLRVEGGLLRHLG